MTAMIVFIVLFVLSLTARLTLGAYMEKVSWLAGLMKPLTVLTVIFGIVMGVLIALVVIDKIVSVIKEFRK